MDITIKINCDNDAFFGSCGNAVARLLRELANGMDGESKKDIAHWFDGKPIMDVNGNKVGKVEVDE